MSFTVVVVPGSPAVVRELAPQDAFGELVRALMPSLIDDHPHPIHIVGSTDPRWRTDLAGSFHAWGADVSVGDGHDLAELIGRYLVGCAGAGERVTEFRGSLEPLDPDAITVVVVDGPAGLTQRAPLALVDKAPQAHEALRALLAGTSRDLPELAGVIEPDLWHELAALEPTTAELIADDDSLGVGRYVARWEV